MTSVERTAYPQFPKLMTARELHVFYTPSADEAVWARERTDTDDHLLALTLALKSFQRMGRFPRRDEVPEVVVDHVRRCLELGGDAAPVYSSPRTAESHRALVRTRQGVTRNPGKARKIAEKAIRRAALVKNNPPDLINVALERLVQASLELPGFSTLDEMASRIRAEVNAAIFQMVGSRLGVAGRARLEALLFVGADGKSGLQRLKRPARRASWSRFRDQRGHLEWVDALGDAAAWVEGVAASKIADFAAEAEAGDADVLSRYQSVKRAALLACLVHTAQARARDDLAQMLCKRMAGTLKKGRLKLEEIRERQRAMSERLIGTYRVVLEHLDPEGETAAAGGPNAGAARAVAAVEEVGGFAAQLADIEEVSAYHGDNYELLVARYFKSDRATALALAGSLTLQATSADHSVLDALMHAVTYWSKTRDFIPDHVKGVPLDLSFASANWARAIRDRKHPGMLVKRHFEAMVFTYLAEELRTGDIAVAGAVEFGDWSKHLLSYAECAPLIPEFCAEVGLPATAEGFTAALKERHAGAAADLDAGYPDNADLVIDDDGVPVLKPLRGMGTSKAAVALAEAVRRRMPERTLIQILARTAYWLQWWRHFGPVSGNEPKLKDPQGRYVLATFACGSNLGPYEAARHIPGITAHEISLVKNRHATIAKLNKALVEVVNAFARLDVVKAWGDGSAVATDGTQVDTYIDNLLAETSIRYGGFGGIAYHYVSDHYIALFSRFVPVGAWEAIYIIDGLLANASDVKPGTIHADTQGQSFPVFTLAHLFGFDLMPRIRNWKDLIFFRHSADARYEHIETLFGEGDRNVINWRLIEKMWPDLMRVAISIREGRLNSITMLRRLTSSSRRNEIYRAFREVGRSVRTVALLRYLADPALRRRVTAATNKVEAYNGFAGWLRFGNAGVIADNDPAEQEKIIKFNSLLANCVIFHTALDMTEVIRQLIAEGWEVTAELLAQLSPYLTEHINQFGIYPTDDLHIKPQAFDPELADVDFDTLPNAA